MPTTGGSEEGRVAAMLRAELSRIRLADPFVVLGVPQEATSEAIRWAFLEATKRFHPNRFARESAETRDLATEVFLLIRSAYDQIHDETRRAAYAKRLLSMTGKQAPAKSGFAKAIPRVTGKGRAVAMSAQRPAVSAQRPAVTPAPAPPAVSAQGRIVASSAGHVVPPQVAGQGALLEEARCLLSLGRFHDASVAFAKIAAASPDDVSVQVRAHLALGLGHHAENRPEEARRELERCLELDPACTEAIAALKRLQEPRRGLLSRFLGR